MASEETKQFILVELDHHQYGIEINYIVNIIVMQSITRVPKAQSYYPGVINLRGDIIPVMSLRKKLGLKEDEYTPSTRIIIVRTEAQSAPVGIIVDEVKEVITIENTQIEKMSYDEKEEKSNYSIGIGKFENDLINLLNIPGVILGK